MNSIEICFIFINCKHTDILKTKGFQTLLEYPDNFPVDLIISDATVGPCLLGFVHKFKNPPLVSVTAYSNPSYFTAFIGGHNYYAYTPHTYLLRDVDMNIFERIYNFAVYNIEYL